MIRVKFMSKGNSTKHLDHYLAQFPGRNPVWSNCEFLFDPNERRYDWLAVYDDLASVNGERISLRKEELACPSAQTILVTTEPSSIKTYGYDYLNQFGAIITSHERWSIPHAQAIYTQPALRWFYGRSKDRLIDYDELRTNAPLQKTQGLSTVCSSKKFSQTLHRQRYEFTQAVKKQIPEMEIFGHGVRWIDDKAEALIPYRYHLAIENHLAPHHWTEKLSDSFIGCTLPLYVGAPNVYDYFPRESVVLLDITDWQASIEMIRDVVFGNEYQKRFDAIIAARELVLDQYNLFAVLSREIEKRKTQQIPADNKQVEHLLSRRRSRHQSLKHTCRFTYDMLASRVHRALRAA